MSITKCEQCGAYMQATARRRMCAFCYREQSQGLNSQQSPRMTIRQKQEIANRYRQGEGIGELACHFRYEPSQIRSVLAQQRVKLRNHRERALVRWQRERNRKAEEDTRKP